MLPFQGHGFVQILLFSAIISPLWASEAKKFDFVLDDCYKVYCIMATLEVSRPK
jgi:hypothetical protein